MTRVRASPLAAAAILALALAPAVLAAPFVPDLIQGAGRVSWFQVFAFGLALEGAGHDYTDVCADCYIRFTTTEVAFAVVDASGEAIRALDPGLYELREFRGLYAFSQEEPGSFLVQVHGLGKVVKLG